MSPPDSRSPDAPPIQPDIETPDPDDTEALRLQIESLEDELDQSRQTVDALERRQSIDALLAQAGAIDLEAARLLTQVTIATMDEPDVQQAVAELRRGKPYLFRTPRSAQGSAMSAEPEPHTEQVQAADRAAMTGDRRDLLAYLRLKRR